MPVWACIQPLMSVPRPPNYNFFFLELEIWCRGTAAEWIMADLFASELLAAKLSLDTKYLKRSRQVFSLRAYGCNYLVAEKFNQLRQQQHKMCHMRSNSTAVRKGDAVGVTAFTILLLHQMQKFVLDPPQIKILLNSGQIQRTSWTKLNIVFNPPIFF